MGKKEVFTFLSSDRKTSLHGVMWTPAGGKVYAVVQITHGMIEYIERYEDFARYLNDQGIVVVGHDHLGHGQSIRSEADWGYFAEEPSDTLVEDMHLLRSIVRKRYPDLPYFMLGHSMGSFMLRKYLALHGQGLYGAIIVGTGYKSPFVTEIGKVVARVLIRLKGGHAYSRLIDALFYGRAFRQFDRKGGDTANSWLTKDQEIVRKYYADSRCTFRFTVNGYLGLFEALFHACIPENAEKIPKDLPIFLVSGADDPVGDMSVGVKRVYELYKHAGIRDLSCNLYANDRHEILNETDREKIYRDLYHWIKLHME